MLWPGTFSFAPLNPSCCTVVNEPMTRPSRPRLINLLCHLSMLLFLLTSSPLAYVETRAYRPAMTFGHEGRETGEFRQPGGIMVDGAGRLYVADTYNHRIQVFHPNGRFIATFGAEGMQFGALLRPKGLAWGGDQLVYVADTGNHRIQAYDHRGEAVMMLGGFGNLPGQFNAPEAVAIDAQNMLYIADTQNHRVQKFASDGTLVGSWGRSGSGKGEFLSPSDIALDSEGRVFVADTQNHRVQVFTASGEYLWEIGRAGRGAAEFDGPRGVATDNQGSIYVADTGNGRVQIFDRTGHYLAHVGHLGQRPGEFYSPAALWIDPQRTLYVADTINHRVQVLTYFPALAQIEQGWQAFRAARLEAALHEWQQALALDPSLAEALYGSGLAYARQGQLDLAIQQLNAALVVQPQYSEARWALYRTYGRKLVLPLGAVGLTAGLLTGMLFLRRLRHRMLRERARHFLEEGRVQETIAIYERLLQRNRHDLNVCKVLETLYEQEGLESKRQHVNELIARLEPENVQALSYLGKQQFAERRFGEAQETWQRILQQNASWAEAHFYLGAVQAERGQTVEALGSYERAFALAMASFEPIAVEQIMEPGQLTEAPLATIITTWERVLTHEMRYEQALATFTQTRQMLAQHHIARGQALLHSDQAQEALLHLRWASAFCPEDHATGVLVQQAQTKVLFDQGMRYYQMQDYVQALRCFRETLALDPEHERAKRYLRYTQQSLEGGVSERFRHLDLGDREKN